MAAPDLKLVGSDAPAASRLPAVALALFVAVSAALATLGGADAARRRPDPRIEARRAIETSLETGVDHAEVLAAARALHREVARRPLDGRVRASYAALQLGRIRHVEELRVPAFHARIAARLSPVSVPVVRVAARVLARCGERGEASALAREMFAYDPNAATELLESLEPLLYAEEWISAIPDEPDAKLAWARALDRRGLHGEARALVEETQRRWPHHVPLLRRVVSVAVHERDWERAARLLDGGEPLAERPETAALIAYRARVAAARGQREAAERDIAAATRLGGRASDVALVIGDTHEALGQVDEAKRKWSGALFRLDRGATDRRVTVLGRLARLEDRVGRPALALARWREIVSLDPQHAEARQRVATLSGLDHDPPGR